MERDIHETIKGIEKNFLSCMPLKSFSFGDNVTGAWYHSLDGQKLLLQHTVFHPLVKKWPIKRSYVQNFLKTVITQLEVKECEVLDEMYTVYCELLGLPDLDTHYKHYILNKSKAKTISLIESNSIISCGTTGLCTWQASLVLAEWALQEEEFLKNKCILELGSGIGLTGLAVVCHCEPECFCFSDVHPGVLQRLKSNILINTQTLHKSLSTDESAAAMAEELNSESNIGTSDSDIVMNAYANNTEIYVLNLPWEDVDKCKALKKLKPFDVILAADVVYDSSLFKHLCKAICYFVAKSNCVAFLACTIRNKDTLDEFLQLLLAKALIITEQAVPGASNFIYSNEVPVALYKISSYR